jgi:hypothetical protein
MGKILYRPDGTRVRAGRSFRTLEFHPLVTNTLPSWLTSSGTVALTTAATSPGTVTLTSASGTEAKLTGPTLNVPSFRELLIELEGLSVNDSSGFTVTLGLSGTNQGVQYQEVQGSPGYIRQVLASSVDTTINFQAFPLTGRRCNLSLMWQPNNQVAAVFINNELIAEVPTTSAAASGTIAPTLTLLAPSTSRTLTFSQIRITAGGYA